MESLFLRKFKLKRRFYEKERRGGLRRLVLRKGRYYGSQILSASLAQQRNFLQEATLMKQARTASKILSVIYASSGFEIWTRADYESDELRIGSCAL